MRLIMKRIARLPTGWGCAVGAATHETVESALAGVMELQPAPQASLFGRKEKVDIANAAIDQRHQFAHL